MSECCIKFPAPVSRATINQLVIEYLKYILYYRGQLPLPLDQLKLSIEKNISAENSVKIDNHSIYFDPESKLPSSLSKPSITTERTKRLFEDTINKFDEFFKQLLIILEDKDVLEVVMNLGPNMMSPKELHRITLPNCCTRSECLQNPAPFQRCRLLFFRSIMHGNLLENLGSDNLLSISVLLLLRTGVPLTEHMEQKRFYAPPKKCKQVTVRFDNSCCEHIPVEEFGDCSLTESHSSKLNHSGLWVKLKHDLRGFKAHKSLSNSTLL